MKMNGKSIMLAVWTFVCLNGFIRNVSHYSIGDCIVLLLITAFPYLILWFRTHRRKASSEPGNSETAIVPQSSAAPSAEEFANLYVEDRNQISRIDGKPIQDDEIPHLIHREYKAAIQQELEAPNPKFHRTGKEEELSFQFSMKYSKQIEAFTSKFENLYAEASDADDVNEKISYLQQSIRAFEQAKKFCYNKGKGGTIYFQDMWEYLHNSQNQCFSYLDNIENDLAQAISEKNDLISDILVIVSDEDGILQEDIYDFLPSYEPATIQKIIKELETAGQLNREKRNGSYILSDLRKTL